MDVSLLLYPQEREFGNQVTGSLSSNETLSLLFNHTVRIDESLCSNTPLFNTRWNGRTCDEKCTYSSTGKNKGKFRKT